MNIAMPAQMMCLWTAKTRIACFLAVVVPCIVWAGQIVVPPSSAPEFADTEVSTNIPFSASDRRFREIEMRFSLDGSAVSNCIQVAFGRDMDGDGVLGVNETEALFGWRNGRYFAESVQRGVRVEEDAGLGGAAPCSFSVDMRLARGRGLEHFSATNGLGEAVLSNLSAADREWLYDPEWNLLRVTRRGPGAPGEWFAVETFSHLFSVTIH